MASARREGACGSGSASQSAAARPLSFPLYTYTAPPVSTAPPPTGEGGSYACTTFYTATRPTLTVTPVNSALYTAMRRRCHLPHVPAGRPGFEGGEVSLPAPKSPTFSGQGRATRPVRTVRSVLRGPCWRYLPGSWAPQGWLTVAGRPFGPSDRWVAVPARVGPPYPRQRRRPEGAGEER